MIGTWVKILSMKREMPSCASLRAMTPRNQIPTSAIITPRQKASVS
jgi:hypothetical protein